MDEQLIKRIEAAVDGMRIAFLDDAKGDIELIHGDQKEPYTLKPLAELYGPGTGQNVDPQNDVFMPLFLSIEEEISKFDSTERTLVDGDVKIALNQLSMSPEAPSGDPLVLRLQMALRMNLSVNNYSRQEVRQAIRKIGKSVDRHNEGGRGRGYINFIAQFVARLNK